MAERALILPHGTLRYPVFLPDATFGVVRTVDAADLEMVGIEGVVMNTFHLMQKPGSDVIRALGGLHPMSGWNRPIITDSGGFQAYSLIRQNPKFGRMDSRGITFQPEGGSRKYQLTPEKAIQLQMSYESDVVICLDDCTHVDAPAAEQRRPPLPQRHIQFEGEESHVYQEMDRSVSGPGHRQHGAGGLWSYRNARDR